MNRRPMFTIIAVAMALFHHGCASCPDPLPAENLSRLVWIKYVHVANVTSMQADYQNRTIQISPSGGAMGGFWAVFDICSLDVQGKALAGFNYSAGNLYVEEGKAKYGPMNPGGVNYSGSAKTSVDLDVQEVVRIALKLSPSSQYFPKQFYPSLRYRVAVYVNGYPSGYKGGILDLSYANHPVVMQNITNDRPAARPFYNPVASAEIVSTCP